MHLYTEAQSIAIEAWEESGGVYDDAMDFIHQSCDGHEVSIYYHKGIKFCAEQDTSDGEDWLEGIGGIAHEGDSFGAIACRIAFATLYCAACEALNDIQKESEQYVNVEVQPIQRQANKKVKFQRKATKV